MLDLLLWVPDKERAERPPGLCVIIESAAPVEKSAKGIFQHLASLFPALSSQTQPPNLNMKNLMDSQLSVVQFIITQHYDIMFFMAELAFLHFKGFFPPQLLNTEKKNQLTSLECFSHGPLHLTGICTDTISFRLILKFFKLKH